MAKRDFLGSMKETGIFLGREKDTVIFLGVYFSSAQINNKISTIYCWCGIFLEMLKKVGIFLVRQILKLGFSWVRNMNLCH